MRGPDEKQFAYGQRRNSAQLRDHHSFVSRMSGERVKLHRSTLQKVSALKIPSMRKRIDYLRQQARSFRKEAEHMHDDSVRSELIDLAGRCEAIALKIEQNLSIHEGCR